MLGVVRRAAREVELTELPDPQLEPGTALVRIRACGICGSDLHSYRRGNREDPPGYWWGHEAAGEVVEMIPHPGEAPRVRVGDLVTVDPPLARACGLCGWCLDGAPVHCENKRGGADWTGMYAPLAKRDVRGLFPLRGSMDARLGALVEPLAVSVHAVRLAGMRVNARAEGGGAQRAGPWEGARVAVLGAGTIGLTALMAARGLGAAEVYVTARHPHQAELARALGADKVLPEDAEESETALADYTSGAMADLVIETVGGTAPTVNQGFQLVRRRGTVAILGLFEHPMPLDVGRALNREATAVFPMCYGSFDGVPDFQVAIDLIASGKTGIERLATHYFPLADAVQAFRTADDKSSGSIKVILEA